LRTIRTDALSCRGIYDYIRHGYLVPGYISAGTGYLTDNTRLSEGSDIMNDVKVFENEQFGTVRTLEENGKVLFCGKDIAVALLKQIS